MSEAFRIEHDIIGEMHIPQDVYYGIHSVRAAEISAEGKSIFAHDPHGKVAQAYENLTKEVLQLEKQRQKHKAEQCR